MSYRIHNNNYHHHHHHYNYYHYTSTDDYDNNNVATTNSNRWGFEYMMNPYTTLLLTIICSHSFLYARRVGQWTPLYAVDTVWLS